MQERESFETSGGEAERARLRRVFIQVMVVQAVALLLLWLLQTRFGSG